MNVFRGARWTVALPLLLGLAAPAHAGWCDAQLTCHRCRQAPAVAYYAPGPCGTTVVAYAAPVCQCRCRCGPLRRLFGRCCKPRCCCPPAVVAVPASPPRVVVPVAPPAAPPVTVTPGYPVFPGAAPPPPPAPAPVLAPPASYNRSYPSPGLGSAYRPLPPLTPPTPPPPVRLDRIASYQADSATFQLVPSGR